MDWETSERRKTEPKRTLLREPLLARSCFGRLCPVFMIGAGCVFLGYLLACFLGGGCR